MYWLVLGALFLVTIITHSFLVTGHRDLKHLDTIFDVSSAVLIMGIMWTFICGYQKDKHSREYHLIMIFGTIFTLLQISSVLSLAYLISSQR